METRIPPVDDGEVWQGFAIFSAFEVDESEVVSCVEIVAVYAEYSLEIGGRAVKILDFIPQQRAVKKRGGAVRLQFERIVVVRHGTEIIVKVIADERPVEIIVRLMRAQADCLVHVGERVLPLLAFHLDVGAQQVWLDGRSRQADGFADVGERAYCVALDGAQAPTGGVALVKARINAQKGRECGIGVGRAA